IRTHHARGRVACSRPLASMRFGGNLRGRTWPRRTQPCHPPNPPRKWWASCAEGPPLAWWVRISGGFRSSIRRRAGRRRSARGHIAANVEQQKVVDRIGIIMLKCARRAVELRHAHQILIVLRGRLRPEVVLHELRITENPLLDFRPRDRIC